ncbi:MAG: metal ABC transporter permease, partial [Alphaproteobacteria bacterium]|nr:metal ABC transporter permease [Alphaproteobacteria bacterium]
VRSPEGMAVLAGVLGVLSVCGGLYGSLCFDFPPGPSIVVTATTIFALLLPMMLLVRNKK